MKKKDKKLLLAFLLLFGLLLVLAVLSVWGRHRKIFDYGAHLDETVFSVDEVHVTLREFGYYIYEVEDYVNQKPMIPRIRKATGMYIFQQGKRADF